MKGSRVGAVACILSLGWGISLIANPSAALTGYLFAYITIVTLVVGALLQAMISYLTGATWFALLRRYNWMIVAGMTGVAVLALPLVLGARTLYPWTVATVPRSGWLTMPWFVARTALYLATWSWFTSRMVAAARQQDRGGATGIAAAARRLRRLSAGGTIAVGVTLTFAGFDWVMSRDPAWVSTIFGVYLFAGGYLSALALIALCACMAPSRSLLAQAISAEQRAALATLIFMAAILWGYIAFSQFLIIWIGDIPADAHWYLARGHGGWRILGFAVLGLEFALPFALLLFRRLKRDRRVLAVVASLVLIGHVLDGYWTAGPTSAPAATAAWHGALALAALIAVIAAASHGRRHTLDSLPQGDPDLDAAIAYRRP